MISPKFQMKEPFQELNIEVSSLRPLNLMFAFSLRNSNQWYILQSNQLLESIKSIKTANRTLLTIQWLFWVLFLRRNTNYIFFMLYFGMIPVGSTLRIFNYVIWSTTPGIAVLLVSASLYLDRCPLKMSWCFFFLSFFITRKTRNRNQ